MPKQTKKPADPSTGPVAQFGYDLRMLRQKADKTYAAIAACSFYSKSAVHAVDQGHNLPSVNVLRAFVTTCDGEPDAWLARRAAIAEQLSAHKGTVDKPSHRSLGIAPPDPTTARTVLEYNDALKRLREWSGKTFRQIEEITKDYERRVAPSTLCGAFTRGSLPARDLVDSFLRALDLDDDARTVWLTVWQAVKDGHPARPAPSWLRRTSGHHPVYTAAPAVTDEPTHHHTAADLVDPPPQPEHPTFEIRDWVFVDGHWRAADEHDTLADAVIRHIRAVLTRLRPTPAERAVAFGVALGVVVLYLTLLLTTFND